MQNRESHCAAWTPRVPGALRIVVGFLLLAHGTAKLPGVPHIARFDGLQLFSLQGLAGALGKPRISGA